MVWLDYLTHNNKISLDRRSESLMELNQSVQTQMEASQILQKRRQGYVSSLAHSFGDHDSSLSQVV